MFKIKLFAISEEVENEIENALNSLDLESIGVKDVRIKQEDKIISIETIFTVLGRFEQNEDDPTKTNFYSICGMDFTLELPIKDVEKQLRENGY